MIVQVFCKLNERVHFVLVSRKYNDFLPLFLELNSKDKIEIDNSVFKHFIIFLKFTKSVWDIKLFSLEKS